MNFPKSADIHTDGKKVTPKDPLRINARDLKTYRYLILRSGLKRQVKKRRVFIFRRVLSDTSKND